MGALAARALRDQETEPRQRGRVVLDHLHVHQRRADPVGHGDPVPGADEGIRRRVVDLAVAAARQDHRLGGEQLHRAVPDVARDRAGDAALVVLDERGREPLLVAVDVLELHELLVEDVQDRLAGDVGDVVGPGGARAAEGALAEPALLVAVEGHAPVLEVEQLLGRLAAHDLDRVLVAEVVRALDRVEGVRLPRVLRVERRVDPALSRVRVGANGVDLGDDAHGSTLLRGGEGGALAGEAGPYDEDIVLRHSVGPAILWNETGGPLRPRRAPPSAARAARPRS